MRHGQSISSNRQINATLNAFQFKKAVEDFWQGLKLWRIWINLSWQEFRGTYRRSVFGITWVILSFAGFIFIKLMIFSGLLETADAKRYNAYLVIGLYIWFYLVLVINAAPHSFTAAQGWIKSEPLPYSLYVFKNIMRELYNLVLTAIVVLAAFIYLKFPVSFEAVYAIPAFLFYILNAVWLKLFLGIVGARFRDIIHLVSATTLPLMFLTPIFWMPEQLPGLMKYLWWNPLFHFLEIARAPIVDGTFPGQSWLFCLCVFGIGSVLALLTFARFRQRIIFWF